MSTLISFTFHDPDVAKKTKEYDNASALVEALLANHFGMEIHERDFSGRKRKQILDKLKVFSIPNKEAVMIKVKDLSKKPEPETIPLEEILARGTCPKCTSQLKNGVCISLNCDYKA